MLGSAVRIRPLLPRTNKASCIARGFFCGAGQPLRRALAGYESMLLQFAHFEAPPFNRVLTQELQGALAVLFIETDKGTEVENIDLSNG